ncbi:MAG: hypothetical protein HF312_20845 [Ignavibacteria bacterium]|jgi:hypothetical protein|nr:hypothetical protein [Ignavibacteria bacterium]MCU7522671.1 hypothetical protein [Ignavibacteria bacterium]
MKTLRKFVKDAFDIPFSLFPIPEEILYPLDYAEGMNEEEVNKLISRPAKAKDLNEAYLVGTKSAAKKPILTEGGFDFLHEIKPGYFFMGYWGYGVNSYSFYYARIDRKSRVYFRLLYGGYYTDDKEDAAEIREFLLSYFKYENWLKENSKHFIAINVTEAEFYKAKLKDGKVIISKRWREFISLLPLDAELVR